MKILVISPFTTYPPDNGGKIRIFNINKNVSNRFKVSQFSLNMFRVNGKIPKRSRWTNKFNENYVEYCYSPYVLLLFTLICSFFKVPPYTYVGKILRFFRLSKLKKLIEEYDIIQVHQPWLFELAHKLNKDKKPMIFFTHNVEYLIVKDSKNELTNSPFRKDVLKKTFKLEEFASNNCDLLVSVSNKDSQDFIKVYKTDKKKIKEIVGGVDTQIIKVPSEKEKNKQKEKLGFKKKKIVLFIGGNHYANIDAVKYLEKIAANYKEKGVVFLTVGTVAQFFKSSKNMVFVPDSDIKRFFRIADVAVNPMRIGSGADVKVLEYLGYGIPTVSTSFGLRGYDIKGEALVAEDIQTFCRQIKKVLKDKKLSNSLSVKSRKLIEKKYDWKSNAKEIIDYYKFLKNAG